MTGFVDRRIQTALRDRAVVLMYHRVLTSEESARTGSHPGIVTSVNSFEAQMLAIKERFRVLGMRELIDAVAAGRQLQGPACIITFDDGWIDTYTNAFPVLRRLALPACVFLPVNYIGGKRLFWRETLTHLVVHAIGRAREEPGLGEAVRAHLETVGLGHLTVHTPMDPHPRVVRSVSAIQAADGASAWRLIHALRATTGIPPDDSGPDRFISWSQVREMAGAGIAFGAHGAEHVLLNNIAPGDAERDIRISRDRLFEESAGAVEAFSYPNGSWNPQISGLVRDAGFGVGFTTRPGIVRMSDNPMIFGRYNVHDGNSAHLPTFLARVAGLIR